MGNTSSLSNKKWMITSIVLVLIFIVYVIIFPPNQSNKETLAEVNGVTISKDQLFDTLYTSGGEQALQGLIEKELIEQEADEAGIVIQDADIEKELAKVKLGFLTEEEFTEALAYYGMTLESMKKDLVVQLQLTKLLEPQITITDEQIEQYYTDNLDALKILEEVKASHILVATQKEAETILADLNNGADFAEVAKEKSLDTASKENGGDLEFFTSGTREQPFETAAFALEVGKLSEVVETSEGYHIIKVMARNAEVIPTLAEKTEEIREQLLSDEVSTLSSTWLEQKNLESSIKIFE